LIRAAVIGLGRWGRNHVRAVQGSPGGSGEPGAQLRFMRAVVQTPEKSAGFAREYGLELGTDFDAALADPSIDAVVLATPNSQHAAQVRACAAAGKSVLSEKPLALTLEDARSAVQACIDAGVVLTVGQDKRHWPSMRELGRVVASGVLGPVLHAEGHFSNENQKHFFTSWRERPEEAPASSLTATGIHVLDAMIHLFGPVARARASSVAQPPPDAALDALTLVFDFVRPMSAVLCGVRPTPVFWRLHVFGRDGSVEAIGDREVVLRLSGEPVQRMDLQPVNSLRLQLDAFAAAVTARAGPASWPIPPGEMLGTIAALDAVARSLRSGATAEAGQTRT
jgi:predicted dehydrogenase